MQAQHATSVAAESTEALSQGVEIIFRNLAVEKIRPLLRSGSRVEVKLNNCAPDDLSYFMDLRHRSAITFEAKTVRVITAMYTSRDMSQRSVEPISFILTDEFEKWESCPKLLFKGMGERLDYVKIRLA